MQLQGRAPHSKEWVPVLIHGQSRCQNKAATMYTSRKTYTAVIQSDLVAGKEANTLEKEQSGGNCSIWHPQLDRLPESLI